MSAIVRVLIGYCILAVTMLTHIVACAGLVAHPDAVRIVVEIPLLAAETLVSILRRHVESPSDVAVLVAELSQLQVKVQGKPSHWQLAIEPKRVSTAFASRLL